MDKRRRRRLTFDEFSPVNHEVSSKRTCYKSTVSAPPGGVRLHQIDSRPAVVDGSMHHGGLVDLTRSRQPPDGPSTLSGQPASSPLLRQLPVVPKPRLPVAIFASPTLLSASVPFRDTAALPFPPFCLPPAAVPPSSPPPRPLPPPPFGLYYPAFWGALPYLIGRALCGQEKVTEDTMSGYQSQYASPGLHESQSRSSESRQTGDPGSLSTDLGVGSVRDSATRGLEDMARMVSRLDDVTKMLV